MFYKELMELIEHIDQSNLDYVDYETKSHHVVISREVPQAYTAPETTNFAKPAGNQVPEATVAKEEIIEDAEEPKEKPGEIVKSPMVGVAYLKPRPDEAPYVQVGDRVEQGDVVCIIEVMKLMNEIQAPCSGTVTEILVGNEEVVEYDQPLIRIEKE